MNDARSSVRRAALLGLRKLAEHAALWPADCVEKLVRAATDSQEMEHTMLCLQVMQVSDLAYVGAGLKQQNKFSYFV